MRIKEFYRRLIEGKITLLYLYNSPILLYTEIVYNIGDPNVKKHHFERRGRSDQKGPKKSAKGTHDSECDISTMVKNLYRFGSEFAGLRISDAIDEICQTREKIHKRRNE